MSVGNDELASLVGKKVILSYLNNSLLREIDGTLLAVVPDKAILVRDRSDNVNVTVLLNLIESIEKADESRGKKVVARVLASVTNSNVNSHLADRHGYLVSVINQVSIEMALKLHGRIDHEDMGHTHDERD